MSNTEINLSMNLLQFLLKKPLFYLIQILNEVNIQVNFTNDINILRNSVMIFFIQIRKQQTLNMKFLFFPLQ